MSVSELDKSGNYIYNGLDVGIFKEPQGDTVLIKRIVTTDTTKLIIGNMGADINYQENQKYVLGYRVLYKPVGTYANPTIETLWKKVENSTFRKSGSSNLPVVTTGSTANIEENSATVSGDVTDDGGAVIVERGILYSTNSENLNINETESTGTTGKFSVKLIGLQPNTTYYYQAYAKNSNNKKGFGDILSFKTKETSNIIRINGGEQYTLAKDVQVTLISSGVDQIKNDLKNAVTASLSRS